MTIFCLGSINADHFYDVPHIPAPGETLASHNYRMGLGGKGANQSVAASQAGSGVVHIGAVGGDGAWAVERLAEFGINTEFIATVDDVTAHAIINVGADGENAIVLYPGANMMQSVDAIQAALRHSRPGDRLILQNEASLQVEAAQMARQAGLQVIYSAAPFETAAVQAILPFVDILAVNEGEAAQLSGALDTELADLPVEGVLVTRGSEGADYVAQGGVTHVEAHKVVPVDTTGAGDTFLGYFVAGLDQGLGLGAAMKLASAASALQVMRPGTADAIPSRNEVEAFSV
ncbi:MAG: ribokinase [Pseudomonadota bacterium]